MANEIKVQLFCAPLLVKSVPRTNPIDNATSVKKILDIYPPAVSFLITNCSPLPRFPVTVVLAGVIKREALTGSGKIGVQGMGGIGKRVLAGGVSIMPRRHGDPRHSGLSGWRSSYTHARIFGKTLP